LRNMKFNYNYKFVEQERIILLFNLFLFFIGGVKFYIQDEEVISLLLIIIGILCYTILKINIIIDKIYLRK